MKNTKNKKTWGLNTDLSKLPLVERKDALVLMYFLNEYIEQQEAFNEIKEQWVDSLYRLPSTSAANYNSIKNGRYKVLSRMRRIYYKYMVKLRP